MEITPGPLIDATRRYSAPDNTLKDVKTKAGETTCIKSPIPSSQGSKRESHRHLDAIHHSSLLRVSCMWVREQRVSNLQGVVRSGLPEL